MQGETKTYQGACHCGAVRFEVTTTLSPAVRCNCSLCRRKGAIMASAEPGSFRLLAGEDALSMYQYNTHTAKHYFCRHCGIYPFHNPRVDPSMYRVNVGCLDDVDPFSLEVGLNDGASFSTVSD